MVEAFKTNFSIAEIQVRAEKERSKGGGVFKKKPEERISRSHILLLPCIYFEFDYLGPVEVDRYLGLSIKGSKKSHSIYFAFWGWCNEGERKSFEEICLSDSDISGFQSWTYISNNFFGLLFKPLLCVDVDFHMTEEVTQGFFVPFDQSPERLINKIFETIKHNAGHLDISNLNVSRDIGIEDLQKVNKVSVIYLPYWLVKFETSETARYVLFDRDGKEDKKLSDALNSTKEFALKLEQRIREIS
jgi:hypothetical protein